MNPDEYLDLYDKKNLNKTKVAYLNPTEFNKLLIEYGYAERLTYDYDRRKALLDGADINIHKLHGILTMRFNCYITKRGFQESLNGIAMNRTAEPEDRLTLEEAVADWVKGKNTLFIKDLLLTEHLYPFYGEASKRSLEIKLAFILKNLGYIRKKSNGKTFWVLTNAN